MFLFGGIPRDGRICGGQVMNGNTGTLFDWIGWFFFFFIFFFIVTGNIFAWDDERKHGIWEHEHEIPSETDAN